MKVVILESLGIQEERLQQLEQPFLQQGIEFVSYSRTNDQEQLKKECKDADVLILANMPLSNEVIDSCTQLKYIDVAFTGVDHVGIEVAKNKGIAVSNASGYSNEAVAELAVGTVLANYRNLRKMEDQCRQHGSRENYLGCEIKGKTVGIIGLGKIGMRSAELFHAFGANIIATKKHPTSLPDWIHLMNMEEVLKQSDIVVLHCPLNAETKGLIDQTKLTMMKKNAILVNMARGPVVKKEDLISALQQNTIAGAILDVFEQEPPIADTDPLLQCKNVIVTPHIGYATKEAMEIRADIVFHNLSSWLQGKQENIIL